MSHRQHHVQQTEQLSFDEEGAVLKFAGNGRWILRLRDGKQFLVGFNYCSCWTRNKSIFVCDHVVFLERQAGKARKQAEATKQ